LEADVFGEYLRCLRKNKKMTIRQLELYSGVSNAYLSQLETGKRGIPSPEILKKLFNPLGVEYKELMIKAGYIGIENNVELQNTSDHIKLPILGTVRAGKPITMNENIEGYETVEPEVMRGRRGFILRVNGDSMSGDYIFDGDKVVVVLDEDISPADIAVVAVNGDDATIKRLKCQDGICVLTPSNTAYEPMIYPADEIHIIGKVVQVRRDF